MMLARDERLVTVADCNMYCGCTTMATSIYACAI